jgi:hypothetical protein
MKASKTALFTVLSALLSMNAFAQNLIPNATAGLSEGSHVGGGGEDIVFKNIRDEVGPWLFKNQQIGKLEEKLSLTSVSGADLWSRFTTAVTEVGDKIVFNNDEIKFGENVRICKNDRDAKVITCNIAEWKRAGGKIQYAIVLHEYLGIAQLEDNLETDYSRYPISGKILHFVKASEAFELAMTSTLNPACAYYSSSSGFEKTQLDDAMVKLNYYAVPYQKDAAVVASLYSDRNLFEVEGSLLLKANGPSNPADILPEQECAHSIYCRSTSSARGTRQSLTQSLVEDFLNTVPACH